MTSSLENKGIVATSDIGELALSSSFYIGDRFKPKGVADQLYIVLDLGTIDELQSWLDMAQIKHQVTKNSFDGPVYQGQIFAIFGVDYGDEHWFDVKLASWVEVRVKQGWWIKVDSQPDLTTNADLTDDVLTQPKFELSQLVYVYTETIDKELPFAGVVVGRQWMSQRGVWWYDVVDSETGDVKKNVDERKLKDDQEEPGLATVGDISDQALAPSPLPFTVGSPVQLIVEPVYRKVLGLDTTDFSLRWYVLAIKPKDRGWVTGAGPKFGLGNIILGHSPTDNQLEGLNIPLTNWQKYIKPVTTITDDELLAFEADDGNENVDEVTASTTTIVRSAKTLVGDITEDALTGRFKPGDMVVSVAKTVGKSQHPEDWINQIGQVQQINEDGTYMVNMSMGIGTFADSDLELRTWENWDPVRHASDNCHTNFVWQKCAEIDSDSSHFLPGFDKIGDLTDDVLNRPDVFRILQRVVVRDKTVGDLSLRDRFVGKEGRIDHTQFARECNVGNGLAHAEPDEIIYTVILTQDTAGAYFRYSDLELAPSELARTADLTEDVFTAPPLGTIVKLNRDTKAWLGMPPNVITVLNQSKGWDKLWRVANTDDYWIWLGSVEAGVIIWIPKDKWFNLIERPLSDTADLTDDVLNSLVVNNVQELAEQFKPGQVWESIHPKFADADVFLSLFVNAHISYSSDNILTIQSAQWSNKPRSELDPTWPPWAGISDVRDFPMVLYSMIATADLSEDVLSPPEIVMNDGFLIRHYNFRDWTYWNESPTSQIPVTSPSSMERESSDKWRYAHARGNGRGAWSYMDSSGARQYERAYQQWLGQTQEKTADLTDDVLNDPNPHWPTLFRVKMLTSMDWNVGKGDGSDWGMTIYPGTLGSVIRVDAQANSYHIVWDGNPSLYEALMEHGSNESYQRVLADSKPRGWIVPKRYAEQVPTVTADLTDDVLRGDNWIVIPGAFDPNHRLHINFQTSQYWNDTPGAVATNDNPYYMKRAVDRPSGWLFKSNSGNDHWYEMTRATGTVFDKAWAEYNGYGELDLDTTASGAIPRVVKYHAEFRDGSYQVIFQVWYPNGDQWFYQVPFDSKEAYELFEVRHKFTPGEKVNKIKDSATMSKQADISDQALAGPLEPGDVLELIAGPEALDACAIAHTRFGRPENQGAQYTVHVVDPDIGYPYGVGTKYKNSNGEFTVEGTEVGFPLEYWQDFFRLVHSKTADLTEDVLTGRVGPKWPTLKRVRMKADVPESSRSWSDWETPKRWLLVVAPGDMGNVVAEVDNYYIVDWDGQITIYGVDELCGSNDRRQDEPSGFAVKKEYVEEVPIQAEADISEQALAPVIVNTILEFKAQVKPWQVWKALRDPDRPYLHLGESIHIMSWLEMGDQISAIAISPSLWNENSHPVDAESVANTAQYSVLWDKGAGKGKPKTFPMELIHVNSRELLPKPVQADLTDDALNYVDITVADLEEFSHYLRPFQRWRMVQPLGTSQDGMDLFVYRQPQIDSFTAPGVVPKGLGMEWEYATEVAAHLEQFMKMNGAAKLDPAFFPLTLVDLDWREKITKHADISDQALSEPTYPVLKRIEFIAGELPVDSRTWGGGFRDYSGEFTIEQGDRGSVIGDGTTDYLVEWDGQPTLYQNMTKKYSLEDLAHIDWTKPQGYAVGKSYVREIPAPVHADLSELILGEPIQPKIRATEERSWSNDVHIKPGDTGYVLSRRAADPEYYNVVWDGKPKLTDIHRIYIGDPTITGWGVKRNTFEFINPEEEALCAEADLTDDVLSGPVQIDTLAEFMKYASAGQVWKTANAYDLVPYLHIGRDVHCRWSRGMDEGIAIDIFNSQWSREPMLQYLPTQGLVGLHKDHLPMTLVADSLQANADISEDILNQPEQEPYPGAKVIFIGSNDVLRSIGLSPGMLNDRVLDVTGIESNLTFYYGAGYKYFGSAGIVYVGGYTVPLAYWQDFIQIMPFSERRSDLSENIFNPVAPQVGDKVLIISRPDNVSHATNGGPQPGDIGYITLIVPADDTTYFARTSYLPLQGSDTYIVAHTAGAKLQGNFFKLQDLQVIESKTVTADLNYDVFNQIQKGDHVRLVMSRADQEKTIGPTMSPLSRSKIYRVWDVQPDEVFTWGEYQGTMGRIAIDEGPSSDIIHWYPLTDWQRFLQVVDSPQKVADISEYFLGEATANTVEEFQAQAVPGQLWKSIPLLEKGQMVRYFNLGDNARVDYTGHNSVSYVNARWETCYVQYDNPTGHRGTVSAEHFPMVLVNKAKQVKADLTDDALRSHVVRLRDKEKDWWNIDFDSGTFWFEQAKALATEAIPGKIRQKDTGGWEIQLFSNRSDEWNDVPDVYLPTVNKAFILYNQGRIGTYRDDEFMDDTTVTADLTEDALAFHEFKQGDKVVVIGSSIGGDDGQLQVGKMGTVKSQNYLKESRENYGHQGHTDEYFNWDKNVLRGHPERFHDDDVVYYVTIEDNQNIYWPFMTWDLQPMPDEVTADLADSILSPTYNVGDVIRFWEHPGNRGMILRGKIHAVEYAMMEGPGHSRFNPHFVPDTTKREYVVDFLPPARGTHQNLPEDRIIDLAPIDATADLTEDALREPQVGDYFQFTMDHDKLDEVRVHSSLAGHVAKVMWLYPKVGFLRCDISSPYYLSVGVVNIGTYEIPLAHWQDFGQLVPHPNPDKRKQADLSEDILGMLQKGDYIRVIATEQALRDTFLDHAFFHEEYFIESIDPDKVYDCGRLNTKYDHSQGTFWLKGDGSQFPLEFWQEFVEVIQPVTTSMPVTADISDEALGTSNEIWSIDELKQKLAPFQQWKLNPSSKLPFKFLWTNAEPMYMADDSLEHDEVYIKGAAWGGEMRPGFGIGATVDKKMLPMTLVMTDWRTQKRADISDFAIEPDPPVIGDRLKFIRSKEDIMAGLGWREHFDVNSIWEVVGIDLNHVNKEGMHTSLPSWTEPGKIRFEKDSGTIGSCPLHGWYQWMEIVPSSGPVPSTVTADLTDDVFIEPQVGDKFQLVNDPKLLGSVQAGEVAGVLSVITEILPELQYGWGDMSKYLHSKGTLVFKKLLNDGTPAGVPFEIPLAHWREFGRILSEERLTADLTDDTLSGKLEDQSRKTTNYYSKLTGTTAEELIERITDNVEHNNRQFQSLFGRDEPADVLSLMDIHQDTDGLYRVHQKHRKVPEWAADPESGPGEIHDLIQSDREVKFGTISPMEMFPIAQMWFNPWSGSDADEVHNIDMAFQEPKVLTPVPLRFDETARDGRYSVYVRKPEPTLDLDYATLLTVAREQGITHVPVVFLNWEPPEADIPA
jgi:hypothetical protein